MEINKNMAEWVKSKKNTGYGGNPFLPKAGTLKEFSQEQIAEYMRCEQDPIYFADKYFKIVHQDHGLVQMNLYDYQREALRIYMETGKLIMATARQVGKTSLATVIILHAALFNEHKNIALLANRKATAKEVLDRIKTAYEYLPDWLKGGVLEWNKESVEFENGSKIFADATEGNSIRGKSIFLLYIDECAFVEDWETFSASVLPTVSANKTSRLIFTSTPNGLNHFYYYCEAAKNKKSDFGYIEVPWWKVDGRDQTWKEKTFAEMNFDQQKFSQEQEVEFLGSSGTLISGAALKLLFKEEPYHTDRGLRMFKDRVPKHVYTLTADVSRGKGLDYSAFHVIDVSTMPYEQVCTYRNNMINATDFASIINQVARHYNNAHTLVELNDLGEQVTDLLYMTHEYEELLCTENMGRGGKQISSGFGERVDRGLRTTKATKVQGCHLVKPIIEQFKVKLVDHYTIEELKTFSLKGNTYEAEPGKHDDLAMGLVLFGWLTNQAYFKQLTDVDVLEELREIPQEDMEDYLLPFGIINDGSSAIDELEPERVVTSNEFDRWMNF